MTEVLTRSPAEGRHPVGWKADITVAAGGTKYIRLPKVWYSGGCSVRVIPAAGATAAVYAGNPTAGTEATYARWEKWPDGDVTANTENVLIAPIEALKLTSAADSTVFEIRV